MRRIRDKRKPGEPRDVRDPREAGDPRDVQDVRRPGDVADVIDRAAFPSDRLIRAATLVMVVVVIIGVLGLVGVVINQGQQIADLNKLQLTAVARQNDIQLCAQHDIVLAVRSIGEKLGLPVEDIAVPNVTGLNCP